MKRCNREESRQVVCGTADRPGETQLRNVMRKNAVDVIEFGGGDGLLGLDHLNRLCHSGFQALTSKIQILCGDLYVAARHFNLLARRLQIKEGAPNVSFEPGTRVLPLGLPLCERRVGLVYI